MEDFIQSSAEPVCDLPEFTLFVWWIKLQIMLGLVDEAQIRSFSSSILRKMEGRVLKNGLSLSHAAAQLHGKVLYMLFQSLAGICLCPLLPDPLLL